MTYVEGGNVTEAEAREPHPGLLADLAQQLRTAEQTGVPIPPLSRTRPELTIADAYEIQRHGRKLRERAGARVVGRKIGLTSRAMQDMLGVDQPDFGTLLASMVVHSGARIPAAGLIAPRVEAEIAFVLAEDLVGPGVSRADVLGATRDVMPALEVIDSRIADWSITIVDTIADNASSAMAVLGAPRPLDGLELEAVEMTMRVGDASERGRGDAVLGHPAEPVAWLANALADYGERLRAGDVVLPGALARALPVAAGVSAEAEFGALGQVTAVFE